MSIGHELDALVAIDDSGQEVHRFLDALVAREAWDVLVELSTLAAERSKDEQHERRGQLFFTAYVAQHRLVVAPPAIAVRVLTHPFHDNEPRVDIVEHLAQEHSWRDLSRHLNHPEHRRRFAYERAARGDDLSGVADLDPDVRGVPFSLESWEPEYVSRWFGPVPRPPAVSSHLAPLPVETLEQAAECMAEDNVSRALLAFPSRWAIESNGEINGTHVRGSVATAFNAAGHTRGGIQAIPLDQALRSLAHASATGGAHGSRDGVVVAREKCWELLAALTGYRGPLAYPADRLGNAGANARFYRFIPDWEPYSRWLYELHIGIEQPATGEAWALSAGDRD